jgi:hypothetical protein
MYDDIDEDLAKAYNPTNIAKHARSNKFPETDSETTGNLLRVTKVKTRKGTLYEFKFSVEATTSELVLTGATYTLGFFPGGEDQDKNAMFWEKVTPFLMALYGETNILTFDSIKNLGELLTLSKGDEDLNFGFRISRKMAPCKPGKDGVVKHKNPDGSAKIFPNDQFNPPVAETAAAA